jgi:ABC-2 type transport system permease protein
VINQIRAEILKIRSTRTTLGLVIGMLVLVIAITVLTGLLEHASDLRDSKENQLQLLNTGSLAGIFASLAGILVVTSETRFGTIRPTFLVTPSWLRILGSKVVASSAAGLVMGILGMLFSYGIGYVCLSQRDIPLLLGNGDIAWLLVGAIVGSAIWGGIGVGIGTVIRNQIGAVIVFLAFAFVLENILFGLVPSVGRYTPLQAQNAFEGSTADHMLAPAVGGLAMLAWMLVLVALGVALTQNRDVA